ncbi:MAG: hypothetical protein ABFD98_08025 [Syntrophobacteraceae bacterium]
MWYVTILLLVFASCFIPNLSRAFAGDPLPGGDRVFQPVMGASVATDESDTSPKSPRPMRYRLGEFELTVSQGGEEDQYEVNLARSGKILYRGESSYVNPEGITMKDVPSKGCESLLSLAFSGGAHCCFTGILCTVCGGRSTWTLLDLMHQEEVDTVELGESGDTALQLLDFAFAYYSAGVTGPSFSFASSPSMYRLYVYGQKGWEPDRPGSNGAYYEKLMKRKAAEIRAAQDDDEAASLAIEATYYSVMAGNGDEVSERLLGSLLPVSWQRAEHTVFRDILKAVREFDPAAKGAHSLMPQ